MANILIFDMERYPRILGKYNEIVAKRKKDLKYNMR